MHQPIQPRIKLFKACPLIDHLRITFKPQFAQEGTGVVSFRKLQIQGQPQGIAPTNRSYVGAILYGCPSVIS